MKEFEKWAKTQDPDSIKQCCVAAEVQGMRRGWLACLEWSYKQKTDPEATEIEDAILKELEEN